jgi:hypothetical protein
LISVRRLFITCKQCLEAERLAVFLGCRLHAWGRDERKSSLSVGRISWMHRTSQSSALLLRTCLWNRHSSFNWAIVLTVLTFLLCKYSFCTPSHFTVFMTDDCRGLLFKY